MSANPVNPSARSVFIGSESTFGTAPAPNTLTLAEAIDVTTGPGEGGGFRPKQDRHAGRAMANAFVAGRQPILPLGYRCSVKTRSAVDSTPAEAALYAACGLKRTTNAGVSVVLSPSAAPLEGGDFASASLLRALGHPAQLNSFEVEVLRGVLFQSLKFSGGNSEVIADFRGGCVSKSVLGGVDSITVNNVVTSLTITAADSYRLRPGYYQCESEIIQVTACTAGGTSATIARGALSTTAASHTAKPLLPYAPALSIPTVGPIGEGTSTVAILGVTTRCVSWEVDLAKTGMDFLQAETGSAYVQGPKATRYSVRGRATLQLKGDDVTLIGKAQAGAQSTFVVSQGTGAGGVFGATLANVRVMPFEVPDTYDDVANVTVEFDAVDSSSGNDAFSITLT